METTALSRTLHSLAKRAASDPTLTLHDVMRTLNAECVSPPSDLLPLELVLYICSKVSEGDRDLRHKIKVRPLLMAFCGKAMYQEWKKTPGAVTFLQFVNVSNVATYVYERCCEVGRRMGSFCCILWDTVGTQIRFFFDHTGDSSYDVHRHYVMNILCHNCDAPTAQFCRLSFHRCSLSRRNRESPYHPCYVDAINLGTERRPDIRIIRFIEKIPVEERDLTCA